MERLSWTDPGGIRNTAIVGREVMHEHPGGSVSYMAGHTVVSIEPELGGYRVNLAGRQTFLRVLAEWVDPQ